MLQQVFIAALIVGNLVLRSVEGADKGVILGTQLGVYLELGLVWRE